MIYKLLTATALTIGLATSAVVAQDANGSGTIDSAVTGEVSMPDSWKGEISGALFADEEGMKLRSSDELATNWANLSAEQQAQVTRDCVDMTTTASVDRDTTSSEQNRIENTNSAAGTAMADLCAWVESEK